MKIQCPDSGLAKEERVTQLFTQLEDWLKTAKLQELIHVCGGLPAVKIDLVTYIDWLKDFSAVWDYRQQQTGGGERWQLQEDTRLLPHRQLIEETVRALGLGCSYPTELKPTYILPLGGIRRANFARTQLARAVIDHRKLQNIRVVALSAFRPLAAIERPYLSDLAPQAENEFEVMNKGLEAAFGLDANKYTEIVTRNANDNLRACVRHYEGRYYNDEVFSLAAPSSQPERRANTGDTYASFLATFPLREQERILLVTSGSYALAQYLRFLDLALEHGFTADCIGPDLTSGSGRHGGVPDNGRTVPLCSYLQEIKSAIDMIYELKNKYLTEAARQGTFRLTSPPNSDSI